MGIDVQFDGIPGPTHNYSGMSRGNLASERHAGRASNPREAALQGLAKLCAIATRGYAQAVLPPHERPHLPTLRALGFGGNDADAIARAAREAPGLLSACSSASAMWTANAATVSASADTSDGRVHFTPANLASLLHRSIEATTTTTVLRAIFADERRFVVHDPLPATSQSGDEGAANHTRFAGPGERDSGVGFFVHGRSAYDADVSAPRRYPARQTREASEAIARRHGLDPVRTVHAQQHPDAIDAGVFHNDVIAVGQGRTLFAHESAWVDTARTIDALTARVGPGFCAELVTGDELTIQDAVATYLFNSQLLEDSEGRLLLVAPAEVREHPRASALLDRWTAPGGPLAEALVFDLRQSMRNGGGPACLRLRVPLTREERLAIRARVFVDDALAGALDAWIRRNYRDRLVPADLADPALLDESRRALDELTAILALPSVYSFQRG
ncbi:MAG: N-succinylarginine dihydrolase [Betaproteobacteria bacterium]